MKEAFGDMLTIECDALCITTNGFVTSNGNCVMGRGIAKQVATELPQVPALLGKLIKRHGNVTQSILTHNNIVLVAFPVKPVFTINQGDNVVRHAQGNYGLHETVPGFHAKADLSIIRDSAERLADLASFNGWKNVILPRPGCGAGELTWDKVKPILDEYLDDRFTSYTFSHY